MGGTARDADARGSVKARRQKPGGESRNEGERQDSVVILSRIHAVGRKADFNAEEAENAAPPSGFSRLSPPPLGGRQRREFERITKRECFSATRIPVRSSASSALKIVPQLHRYG
jgi:hypothetical protein